MSEQQHHHHQIDYVEISVLDIEASKKFFSDAFEWEFTDYAPHYVGLKKNGQEFGGLAQVEKVNGGGPLVILFSNELEKTLEQVKNAGGTIVKEIFEFPGGRRFHLHDPSGNEFAVWAK